MQIKLIYAHALNGVIGFEGDMPWGRSLPEDLAHFKTLTLGQAVIMGRKTWESLPPSFRPLPGRRNIVLSRNPATPAPGAEVFTGLEQALLALREEGTDCVWVIGGAQIYRQALALASDIMATEIDAAYAGDAYAPSLDPQEWTKSEGEWQHSQSGLRFRFVHYQRVLPLAPIA